MILKKVFGRNKESSDGGGLSACLLFPQMSSRGHLIFILIPKIVVFLAAVDLEVAPASKPCTLLSPFSTHLAASVSTDTNRGECSRKWNGLHSPVSGQSRLNLSIEVPSPSQVCFLLLSIKLA